MAHFAQLNDDNEVIQVVVVDTLDNTDPHTGRENEILGKAFCNRLFGGNWIQTSYHGRIRKNYAGIGYTYSSDLDAFIPPKDFPSWVLNEETCRWESPLGSHPTLTSEQVQLESYYVWNEDAYQADNTTGWELVTPE